MKPWLTIIDMQRVFAESTSDWFTPRFDEIIAPIRKLLPSFGDNVVYTRFVAPAVPFGSWRAYYDQWPAELVEPDHRMYDIVDDLTPGIGTTVLSAVTFGKWNHDLAATIGTPTSPGEMVLTGVATDCCVLATAVAAADAGVHVRVVAEACAGLTDESHHKALDILEWLRAHDRSGRAGRRSRVRLPMYRSSVYKAGVTLREPTFLILTALAAQPLHGYGIIKDVESISAGRVVLRAGTLYTALDRLSDTGWVEVDHEEVVDGRLRRYYRLSDTGANELAEETKRLNAIAAAASERLSQRLSQRRVIANGGIA